MVNVFIQPTAVTPENLLADKEYDRIKSIASKDSVQRHNLIDDPSLADVILFIGSEHADMRTLRRHDLYRRYPDRCFVFYAGDHVFPFLPGFFPSIERRCYTKSRTRSVPYLRVIEESSFDEVDHSAPRSFLYSFRGNVSTSPVRAAIMQLQSDRSKLVDTGAASYSSENRDEYISDIEKSSFVLCPRGGGTSSFRIFECMRMGRAPVIISDQWVQPEGPDWAAFSVRVAQHEVDQIPRILEAIEPDAGVMGIAARQAWDQYFDASVYFHYLIQQCLNMRQSRSWYEGAKRVWNRRILLSPRYFRRFLLPGFASLFRVKQSSEQHASQ